MQLGSSKDRWANLKPSSTVRHWHILNYIDIWTYDIPKYISPPFPAQSPIRWFWALGVFFLCLIWMTWRALRVKSWGAAMTSSSVACAGTMCLGEFSSPRCQTDPRFEDFFFGVQVFRILINNINFYQLSATLSATLSGKSRKFHSLTVWKGSQIGSRKFCWASWHGHFEADATTAAFAAVSATRPDSEIRELPLLTDVKLKHSSKCRPGCGKASDDSVMIHICGDFSGQPVTPGQLWGCKQFQATWSLFWHWNGKSTLRCMLLTGAFCCKKLLVSTSLPLPPARISKDPEEARLLKPGNSVYLTATDSHLRFVNDKFIQTTSG